MLSSQRKNLRMTTAMMAIDDAPWVFFLKGLVAVPLTVKEEGAIVRKNHSIVRIHNVALNIQPLPVVVDCDVLNRQRRVQCRCEQEQPVQQSRWVVVEISGCHFCVVLWEK